MKLKSVNNRFFLFQLILQSIFVVILCITTFVKLYIMGIKADEISLFFFRTLFCMIMSIYILYRLKKFGNVETLLMSDRSKYLIYACNMFLILLYLGIYWQFIYETCIADEGNIGSISTILAILVLSNTKYNLIKRQLS